MTLSSAAGGQTAKVVSATAAAATNASAVLPSDNGGAPAAAWNARLLGSLEYATVPLVSECRKDALFELELELPCEGKSPGVKHSGSC